jgi:hypothetical protein
MDETKGARIRKREKVNGEWSMVNGKKGLDRGSG